MSIDNIREKVCPILRAYGITYAGIFGSTARGEDRPDSDVDILVDARKDMSLLDFVGLKLEIEDAISKSVDLVERSALRDDLRGKIFKEEIALIQ